MPDPDIEFLQTLASKFEQETQVYLGRKNLERAEHLRRIIRRLTAEYPQPRKYTVK